MLRKDIGGPLSRSGGGGSEGKGKMHIVLDSADEMGSLNVDDIAIYRVTQSKCPYFEKL